MMQRLSLSVQCTCKLLVEANLFPFPKFLWSAIFYFLAIFHFLLLPTLWLFSILSHFPLFANFHTFFHCALLRIIHLPSISHFPTLDFLRLPQICAKKCRTSQIEGVEGRQRPRWGLRVITFSLGLRGRSP